MTPMTSSTWSGPMPPPVQAPPAIGLRGRHERDSCRGRGRAASPARPRTARARRGRARPGPAGSCRPGAARRRRPHSAAWSTSSSRSKRRHALVAGEAAFFSGRMRASLPRQRRGRAGPPSGCRSARPGRRRPGRCRAAWCPTASPARRASIAPSRAMWYGMITWACLLTRTRSTSMPRAASIVQLGDAAWPG